MNTRLPIDLDTSQAPELHGRNPTAEEYRERIALIMAGVSDVHPETLSSALDELAQLATTLTHIVECRRQQAGNYQRMFERIRPAQRFLEELAADLDQHSMPEDRYRIHGTVEVNQEPIKAGGTD